MSGTAVLQAARIIGPEVAPPTMCYYSKLKTSGGYCRTCIVKVTQGSTANPNPMPKPVASCRTEVNGWNGGAKHHLSRNSRSAQRCC